MNEDEDVINYFQSMSPEEQNKMKPEEMQFISDAMDRQLKQKKPELNQDWGDAKNQTQSIQKPKSYSERTMDKMKADSDANLSGITDSLRAVANVGTAGNAGRILSSDKALGGTGDDDKTEEEWNKIYQGAQDRSPVTSFATGMMIPGGKLAQSAMAGSSGYNAARAHDRANPALYGAINAGFTGAVGAAIDKAAPYVQKKLSGVVGPLLDKVGDRQLGEFLGIPELEIGKMRAQGELEPFIEVLRKHGVLSGGQGRHESLMKGVDATTNVSGPALGKEVEQLPNMHNNELSQMFDSAANDQNMTGVQDRLSKPVLESEAERWANRKGMTSYDPNNNVAIEGDNQQWVSGEPINESLNAPHVTAGNPTNGVDAEPIWTPADQELTGPSATVPRSGIAVPEVTAPHLHVERQKIDERLFDGTKPGNGSIATQEGIGLKDTRKVYSDALDRQAKLAGRENEYSQANKLHSQLSEANTGLSNELKSTDRYGETHPFTKPGKIALEHGRSAVGLGAKDIAAAIKNHPNLMSHVHGGKIGRIADMILQSKYPEVDMDVAKQSDPEWNRFVNDMAKENE